MTAISLIIFTILGIYILLNFKYDIQMLQQNSYRISRYRRWLRSNYMSAWRLVDLAMLFALFSTLIAPPATAIIIALVAICKCGITLRKKYKKPLVFTKRVWRIYSTTAIIALFIYIFAILVYYQVITFPGVNLSSLKLPLGIGLLITILSYCFVILAVAILSPVEKMINRRYYNEAAHILQSMPDLKVIGITGSFGKTSTKHYLEAILSEGFEVLMTPGSYNTPMGVIRTIREMMKPYHEVFICEMGAKQLGDIKEICDLVHPAIGIVTAVGPMHLETFGSLNNVQKTKFELIDTLPADGLGVINNDFELCSSRQVDNVKIFRYAVTNTHGAQYVATNIKYSSTGTDFDVVDFNDHTEHYTTPLVGECNISNLLAAIVVARSLGMPEDKIRYAVSRLSQVEHRLSIKRTPGGVTIIDDAFNSNAYGSKMALDVLKGFSEGKRIIVTPGMIELGDKQYELNKEFGHRISESADIAIVVGHYNREAIVAGILEGNMDKENIYEVESFNEAQKILSEILSSGDTVLYENDLPDTFK